MDFILQISNITKTYTEFKLGPITMNIPHGKITGLIGENGAGKTTLISILLDQVERDTGELRIFGLDNRENEMEIKNSIGFVVDACCLHPCLTGRNINKILMRVYAQWDQEYFFRLLCDLKVDPKKPIKDLSGGMKTKLLLASALAHNPKLLILDEITSGLDPVVRDDVLVLLRSYVAERNASVFFSTHITSDLDRAADDVAFLHNGNLVFHEPIESLRKNYLLLRCGESEFARINPSEIIASYIREGEYRVLMHGYSQLSFGKQSVPSLDDIMLLYIKGASK